MGVINDLRMQNIKSILDELEEPIGMKSDNKIAKNNKLFIKFLDKFLTEKNNQLFIKFLDKFLTEKNNQLFLKFLDKSITEKDTVK